MISFSNAEGYLNPSIFLDSSIHMHGHAWRDVTKIASQPASQPTSENVNPPLSSIPSISVKTKTSPATSGSVEMFWKSWIGEWTDPDVQDHFLGIIPAAGTEETSREFRSLGRDHRNSSSMTIREDQETILLAVESGGICRFPTQAHFTRSTTSGWSPDHTGQSTAGASVMAGMENWIALCAQTTLPSLGERRFPR